MNTPEQQVIVAQKIVDEYSRVNTERKVVKVEQTGPLEVKIWFEPLNATGSFAAAILNEEPE